MIGNSTSEARNSGVVNGVIKEIEGFISQYEAVYPKFIIILNNNINYILHFVLGFSFTTHYRALPMN